MTQEELEALPREYQVEVLEAARIRRGRSVGGQWGWSDPGEVLAEDVTPTDLREASIRLVENQRFREWVPPDPTPEFDGTWEALTNQ